MTKYSENSFVDRTTNAFVSRTTNVWEDSWFDLVTVQFTNLVWGLSETKFVHLDYGLLENIVKQCVLRWTDIIVNDIHVVYGDAPKTTKAIDLWWGETSQTIKQIELQWRYPFTVVKAVQIMYTIMQQTKKRIDIPYSILGASTVKYINTLWDLNERDFTVKAINQIWSLISGQTELSEKSWSVTVSGVPVPVPDLELDYDEGRYTIDAIIKIANPSFFQLFETRNRAVVITVNGFEYHLITREKSEVVGTASTVLSIKCKSIACLLGANTATRLETELTGLYSDIVASLAAPYGITTNWDVWHLGRLVNPSSPAGILFANNETPLDVMRRLCEATGACMQSRPDGILDFIHEAPVRVPDYDTVTPDVVLNEIVKTETMTISEEFNPGYNVIEVSDQLTASTTYQLEQEEITPTTSYIKGFHTPWDEEEIYLTTSGGPTVEIFPVNLDGETALYPPLADSDGNFVEPELIEIINGVGRVSKPIYNLDPTDWEWEETDLGGLTYSEDGTIQSDVVGTSLLKIRYTTKYYKWFVRSPVLPDVQFILKPVIA